MALHVIPVDGHPHVTRGTECGCNPVRREGRYRGQRRIVYAHRRGPVSPVTTDDDYDETFGGAQ